MVLKRFFLALPVLLIFLLSLLLHAPSRLLSGLLPSDLQVEAWGGSLIDGQLRGRVGQQSVQLAWVWHPAALLRLSLDMDIRLATPLQASFRLTRGPLADALAVSALRIPAGAAPWLGQGNVTPGWQGHDLSFSRRHAGAWHQGEGVLTSPGGPLRLDLQGQVQELVLPPARIVWRNQADSLVGELRQADGNAALATLTLTGDNRIQWQVRDRLLRLKAGYASQNDPDLVVLTVAEPL